LKDSEATGQNIIDVDLAEGPVQKLEDLAMVFFRTSKNPPWRFLLLPVAG
jgi:hypothetical protein